MKHFDKFIKRVKLVLFLSVIMTLGNVFLVGSSRVDVFRFWEDVTFPLIHLLIGMFLVSHWVYQFKRGRRGGGLDAGNADHKGQMYHAYHDNSVT